MSDTPRSKKSKAMGKQPDLRQFIFKKMKSQDNSCSSTPPLDSGTPSSNASASPSYDSPQINENDMNLGGSNTDNVPLENEELYRERSAFCFVCYLFKNDIEVNGRRCICRWRIQIRRKKSIIETFDNVSDVIESEYETRLRVSISCLSYLLRQGLAFRGHKEDEESLNRGNFIELLKWLKSHNEVVSKRIIEEIGDDYFAILADESSDVSQKEQLALCLRYVEKKMGKVVERFLGLVHVEDTTAMSLRSAIISLLVDHSLNPSKIRGQGYDGASNMKGKINGLETLIVDDTPNAYYVHCFAHQLQLTLVAIAKKNNECGWLLIKRNIRDIQAQNVARSLEMGELEMGSGLNQELGLKRPGDTRWGSHYKTLQNVMNLFPTLVDVLVMIGKNGSNADDKAKAQGVVLLLESFDFFYKRSRHCYLFCNKHAIVVPNMEDNYIPQGRSRRFVKEATYLHHFRVEVFIGVIDLQLQELNNCFDVVNMELLKCMTYLCPKDGFSSFNKEKVLKLATLYPSEFTTNDLDTLDCQLDIFMEDMQDDSGEFQGVNDLSSLAIKFVETNRNEAYPLVFLLIKLMLILPVATASVERVFSGMTYIKSKLRNSMGHQFLNDCLVTFLEKEVFLQVSNDDIIDRFQKMKTRRMHL
ncbi:uncharacterized protein LOC125492695 [Beta vulgaris subsp. vulgaris]|uniref:uncharacterized protein LOC125492695 n=1 Tax=Beta vulgaris subsp. vulgaris TaxID=3555 RepID=UPI002547581E|nr:uncharacterized protein LOC125492695 [Beta vulgaris subsp. vulgaris]